METPKQPVELTFERISAGDWPDVLALGHAEMDARIASYAFEPMATARKTQLRVLLASLRGSSEHAWLPELSFWILHRGRRSGFVLLWKMDKRMHLQLVVLASSLRGTGGSDAVMRFVERTARDHNCTSIDLFVDRRNYRAYHLYRRHGFERRPERRFLFDVRRAVPPGPRALLAVPLHAAAATLGTIGAKRLADRGGADSWTLRKGGIVALSFNAPAPADAIDAAVRTAFRRTLAGTARVSLAFKGDVRGGKLVAILHRMEKVLP
jgi:ribosomal protein S18 acetylase RimI-like enzyme